MKRYKKYTENESEVFLIDMKESKSKRGKDLH